MNLLAINWNPSLGLDLGFFIIRYYSLMFVIAFVLGYQIMKHIFNHEKVALEKLDKLLMYVVFATILGARLGHVFFYDWAYFSQHPEEILLPFRFRPTFEFTGFAGLASHGAAIGIITSLWYFSKKIMEKPLLYILDRVGITVALAGLFIRLGNFINSEIVGKVVDKSFVFATRFVRNSDDLPAYQAMQITKAESVDKAYDMIVYKSQFLNVLEAIPYRHPSQLYEGLGYLGVFALLFYMYWKTDAAQKQGLLFGTFFALLWSVRFAVEFCKEAQVKERAEWALNTGQWLSIPLVLIGIYFIVKAKKKIV
ncbi:prolipoprotein diacylglyceryl transferase [Wenyingzhuangia sp. 2_MG-2023]|uniref:prolipoprotein diacylglyceryl transferase n=1 Tax=Wenyingzhuangia sp. 2_MG-2023 TaxID=3062639 RepID=UPI0026E24F1C|nr:prolipoprotein diacylglyceryl transferase [Wenyingzhuangia sp. 2_MG-2023]MDO6738325.1 prolipoprotein diacylglyceryl transferase [Wenyingzhuangia sp. 2_MG-2023]MDO6802191.1 prolipoprotein diacylglyceryl transferase [Wenyingzhuangia sp. 1_MG-2023]